MPKPAMARLSMNSVQLLGGSGVVISRVVSPLIWVISIVTLLITLPITTHEVRVLQGLLGFPYGFGVCRFLVFVKGGWGLEGTPKFGSLLGLVLCVV